MIELFYDNSKDLYEGLIIEDDNGIQNQVSQVFPAFRKTYGFLFAAAPSMYEALKKIADYSKKYPSHTPFLTDINKALAKAEGKTTLTERQEWGREHEKTGLH